jgi:hypothetical protein
MHWFVLTSCAPMIIDICYSLSWEQPIIWTVYNRKSWRSYVRWNKYSYVVLPRE